MRPVSARWADGIASSHRLAVEVALLGGETLPIDGGSVTLDGTAATRGRADLSITSPSLIPTDIDSLLAPYSNEFTIKRGLTYADGETEMVQLGVFLVEEVEVSESEAGVQINVSLLDRSQRVIEALFEEYRPLESGENVFVEGNDYLDTLLAIVREALPQVESDFASTPGALSYQVPQLYAEESQDRWGRVQELAAAIGCEIYFGADGKLVLRDIPGPDGEPVAHVVEGQDGVTIKPTLLELTKRWSRTDAHNRWKVVGENPEEEGEPPSAVALDDDPTSPTYYYGPFGRKPAEVFTSTAIKTEEQAQAAASGLKKREMGTVQSLDFGALVNPALEPGDVVRVTRTRRDPADLDNLIEIADENHILDSLTIPLGPGESMSGTTRATKKVPT